MHANYCPAPGTTSCPYCAQATPLTVASAAGDKYLPPAPFIAAWSALMIAPYTPPEGQAVCPHCAHPVAVTLEAPAVNLAALRITCPACGREWNELRGQGP